MAKKTWTTLHVEPPVRATLRQAVVDLTTPVGRQPLMGDVIVAALAVAQRHPDELVALLRESNPT